MHTLSIDVEANGIILTDVDFLHQVLEWSPQSGESRDLLHDFFASDLGDLVINSGAVVPLLSIDDGGYEIICRYDEELSTVRDISFVSNGEFPLFISGSADFYDFSALLEWPSGVGLASFFSPGFYAVTINGFREVDAGRIVRAGYEFVARPTNGLIEPTAAIDAYMRVFM